MACLKYLAAAVAMVAAAASAAEAAGNAISLSGQWAFRLDPGKVGIEQQWFGTALPDKTRLPGSTDENHYGTPNTRKPNYDYLSRLYEYTGPAWYQRTIDIPAKWKGKRVTLFLERCHWETRVWLDDKPMGEQDSLCVPHAHSLGTDLAPGKHRLTVRVDNTLKYDMGWAAHSTSEQTQTNWNGIVGRIELRATDPVWIEDLQVYPDVGRKSVKVRVTIANETEEPASGSLRLRPVEKETGHEAADRKVQLAISGPRATQEVEVPMGKNVRLWDESSPALYDLAATLSAKTASGAYTDKRTAAFGMRKLSVSGSKQFAVNGRTIFLRGTLECCIFPLTGYPSMDEAAWLRILTICKSYGLNHMRFHSWCPPEAAFSAADKMGFLFHVEAPQWVGNVGQDPPRDRFIEEEVKRILDTYGNHPSFGMLCMGNELGGDAGFLGKLVRTGKERDPRHFYTNSTAWSWGPDDDYNVAVIRGLHGPSTDADFRADDAGSRVPIVSHEVGQWAVYPKLDEIRKYTGVLRPRNFELIRDDLAAKHMLDQAADFTLASGKLSVQLYKEEIEVLLRTPGHAGFQLLDLHDFPGQGTALVGTLDAFWDSKGLITPEEYRRFCSPTVPLVRMKKRTWTSDETFEAQCEIAHFGPVDIPNAVPVWDIKDEKGAVVASGTLPTLGIPTGKLTTLGGIKVPLAKVSAPAKLVVTLSIKGTSASNDWGIWVYPAETDVPVPQDVLVTNAWGDAARSALASGRKVLVLASPGALANSIPGRFTTLFWSPVWFEGQTCTMGILCNPKHPALELFPTEMHGNWQWYDLLEDSAAAILDGTPPSFSPIVQVIDSFNRNHKLGDLFEARVGGGRLMVCSIDLQRNLGERPAARQLLRSILSYMSSDRFRPTEELDTAALDEILRPDVLSGMIEEPKTFDSAVLRVKAAVKVRVPEKAEPWAPQADEVIVRESGFDYTVHGGSWRDSTGSAWHDAGNLAVKVTCPKGFEGKLYAHFHDWNNLNRIADIYFQGRKLGTLAQYNGPGKWLAIPVTAKDSADGVLELSARPTSGNAMITQIVLIAGR